MWPTIALIVIGVRGRPSFPFPIPLVLFWPVIALAWGAVRVTGLVRGAPHPRAHAQALANAGLAALCQLRGLQLDLQRPDGTRVLVWFVERIMSSERRKVLEMLADGKITADDAERLLARLAASAERASGGESGREEGPAAGVPKAGTAPLKYLRVIVDGADGDKVNIRVPLALVRTGLKLSTMIPAEAQRKLFERGVDLSGLSGLQGEELIEALRELKVDVNSTSGDSILIFCE